MGRGAPPPPRFCCCLSDPRCFFVPVSAVPRERGRGRRAPRRGRALGGPTRAHAFRSGGAGDISDPARVLVTRPPRPPSRPRPGGPGPPLKVEAEAGDGRGPTPAAPPRRRSSRPSRWTCAAVRDLPVLPGARPQSCSHLPAAGAAAVVAGAVGTRRPWSRRLRRRRRWAGWVAPDLEDSRQSRCAGLLA